ncbi:LysR substrate-binding domain-containing protein [Rahnella sp. Larv3_ips]|uniref:LysR substrate-binding domain-containing protein n=1 Tax=Rahnella sp. Larv3_ips TaxID=1896943 RepID=UPI000EFA58A9|nr:LysR substrate-binding domain-containing protein [Rahnella sp. Larv3_ips]MBB6113266.1 LysR family glycine cleavage system transcriptional activator [Rahnella inusitata]
MALSPELSHLNALNLPSLNVLKTFAVVAQTLNLTHAATLLHITQGAVSRQITGLEVALGYPLFLRQARGLTLTPRGAQLLPPVQQALALMGDALKRVGSHPDTLRIKCPTCSMRWLLPRVIQLQNDRPDMRIELTASIAHGVDFSNEHFDAAVIFGRPPESPRRAHHLFDEVLTPVCTPDFLPRHNGRTEVADLADKTLLHPTRDRRDWLMWLREEGVQSLPSGKSQHFDTLDLAINSALQGYGVAIGDLTLIEDDLQAGRVIAPFPLCVASGAAYTLLYPENPTPALTVAIDFLTEEARLSREKLSALLSTSHRLVSAL